jgi:hypothetical protein
MPHKMNLSANKVWRWTYVCFCKEFRINLSILAIKIQQKDGIIQEHNSSQWKPMWYCQYKDGASEWLLFN